MKSDIEYLSIVNYNDNKFVINEKNLDNFLKKIPEDMPLCIVSILGAYRTGKSFIMNLLKDKLTENKYSVDNSDEKISNIFPSDYGINPITDSVIIYKEPIYNIINNEKTAIILIDTPGFFDTKTNSKMTISLFGLISLISSLIIYNIEKRIQEDHLNYISLFSEYTKYAKDKNKISPNLNILIRDFQNLEDINEKNIENYSNNYINDIMKLRDNAEFDIVRNAITKTFDDLSCDFLPHPGFTMLKKNTVIKKNNLDNSFIIYSNIYLDKIINKFQIKKINDISITKKTYKNFLISLVNLFNTSNSDIPEPIIMIETIQKIYLKNFIEKTLAYYNDYMKKLINNKFIFEKKLNEFHIKTLEYTLNFFTSTINIESNNKLYKTAVEEIKNSINDKFLVIKKENSQKNPIHSILNKTDPISLTGIVLFINRSASICYENYIICYLISNITLIIIISITILFLQKNFYYKKY